MTDIGPELLERLKRQAAQAERELALTLCRLAENERVIRRLRERAELLRLYGPRHKSCCAASQLHARLRRGVVTMPRRRAARRKPSMPRGDPDPKSNGNPGERHFAGAHSNSAMAVCVWQRAGNMARHRRVVKPVVRALLPKASAPCPDS